MELKDLKPNPRNPRKITDKKLLALQKSLKEFGDLSGIVFNRRTGRLVGGHQRIACFKNGSVVYDSMDGNSGHFVTDDGIMLSYREVDWDEDKEKAANIAANKGAGEWDWDGLSEWFHELDSFNYDLDLTMFDDSEREKIMAGMAEEISAPELPSGDKSEFVQMTFTLHEMQAEEIKRAMEIANSMGPYVDLNANKNGNALARVAERFIAENG